MQKTICYVVTCLVVLGVAVLVWGAITSVANKPYPWGGDEPLPVEFQIYFGDDNTARLNYVQSQKIDRLEKSLAALSEEVKRVEQKRASE